MTPPDRPVGRIAKPTSQRNISLRSGKRKVALSGGSAAGECHSPVKGWADEVLGLDLH